MFFEKIIIQFLLFFFENPSKFSTTGNQFSKTAADEFSTTADSDKVLGVFLFHVTSSISIKRLYIVALVRFF